MRLSPLYFVCRRKPIKHTRFLGLEKMNVYAGGHNDGELDDTLLGSQSNILVSLQTSLSKSPIASLFASYRASLGKDLKETFGDGTIRGPTRRGSPVHFISQDPQLRAQAAKSLESNPPLPASRRASSRLSVSEVKRSTDFCSLGFGGLSRLKFAPDDSLPRDRTLSEQIKEGKRPQRSICYDTLIDDISNEQTHAGVPPPHNLTSRNNSDEWFGLEYTLELSRRDVQVSEGALSIAGEHSKSRESWAAIHAGLVHPDFEDIEFLRWRKWHRYLEYQEQKHRVQRVMTFATDCDELAELYLEEWRMRKWAEVIKLEHGTSEAEHSSYVERELAIISRCRPVRHFA
ncbi:hypothetical protein A0H81_03807 [Grifola frondosa]|uniref:Uncharacterized protein n=1 Tax=Grifola frondosa TaxID=5627 RepID=A0A1C7MQ16_GRIFR|nr:hypothetical protein A0H81_03807 [Grifola frondosa]